MSVLLKVQISFGVQASACLLHEIKVLIASSRAERGCNRYEAFLQDDGELLFIEEWKTQESLDLHRKTGHFLAFIDFIEKLRADVHSSVLSPLV